MKMAKIAILTTIVGVFPFVGSIADIATISAVSPSKNVPQDAQAAVAQEELVRGNKLVEWILSCDTVTELTWKRGFDGFRGKIARIEGVVKDVREGSRITNGLRASASPCRAGHLQSVLSACQRKDRPSRT